MSLFQITLLPVDQIEPWGTPPDLSLHWFGLTDGSYFIDLGHVHLLKYSRELGGNPVQYQVARLHEDLLGMLPDILQPIPAEVSEILDSFSLPVCLHKLRQSYDEQADSGDDESIDALVEADRVLGNRLLDSFYLNPGAFITIRRRSDRIWFEWDNRGRTICGKPAWSAEVGAHEVDVSSFLTEVARFHDQLMVQMRSRIDAIKKEWRRPEVDIDVDQLAAEQSEREKTLQSALAGTAPPVDWKVVLEQLALAL